MAKDKQKKTKVPKEKAATVQEQKPDDPENPEDPDADSDDDEEYEAAKRMMVAIEPQTSQKEIRRWRGWRRRSSS